MMARPSSVNLPCNLEEEFERDFQIAIRLSVPFVLQKNCNMTFDAALCFAGL